MSFPFARSSGGFVTFVSFLLLFSSTYSIEVQANTFSKHSLETQCRAAKAAGDFENMVDCSQDLVDLYCGSGQVARANEIADQFIAMSSGPNGKRAEAWGLDFKGNAAFKRSAFGEAFNAFDRSATLMLETDDIFGQATAMKDKGIAQKYLHHPIEAIDTLNTARLLFQKAGDRHGELSALLNIAYAYEHLGFQKQALHTREQVLEIARATGNKAEMYHALVGIGDNYLDAGSAEQALELFQEALDIADETGDQEIYRAWLLTSMAWAHFALGNISEALRTQAEIIRLSNLYGSRDQQATAFRDIGDMYVGTDPRKALDYFRQSLELRKNVETPVRRFTFAGMANAYERLGELDRSIEYYEKALDEFEGVRSGLTSTEQRSAFLRDHQFIYQGMLESLVKRAKSNGNALSDTERAFGIYEAAKARKLYESISSTALDEPNADTEFASEREELSKKISALQLDLLSEGLDPADRNILDESLAAREADLGILNVKVENRRLPAETKNTGSDALVRVQNSLAADTALIAYSVGADATRVFVVSKESIDVETLPITGKDLNSRVQNYVDLLASGDENAWQTISERLGRELASPVFRHLKAGINKLVIVPDGNLHYLPFETLSATTDGRLLIEDFEISYAPSGTVFAQLAEREKTAAKRGAAIFSNPTLGSNFLGSTGSSNGHEAIRSVFDIDEWRGEMIPRSEIEARTIKDLLGDDSEIFSGETASERQVRSAVLEDFQVIHFATHALVSSENPERSSILLAVGDNGSPDDGLLQAREIYQFKKSPDLVVLSACKTANGQILKGEGLQSLAQAFLYAGARTVVGTVWDVNDRRTSELMRLFYRKLGEGDSKAAALREAKLEIMRMEPTPPLYWAPFVLIGEPRETINTSHHAADAGLWTWMTRSLPTLFRK